MISIIICTYKNFDLLEELFLSIEDQTISNYEIIVQDDGSENFDFKKIKNMYKGKNPLRIFTNKENLGTVKSINLAIKNARGEFIFPIAQDDVLASPNALENLRSYFIKNDALVVYSKTSYYIGDEFYKEFNNNYEKQLLRKQDNKKIIKELYNDNFISGATTFFKRDIFDKYGLFDEEYRLLEDYPFFIYILKKGVKIYYYEEEVIKYQLAGVSSGGITNLNLVDDFIKLSKTIKKKSFIKGLINQRKWEHRKIKIAKGNFFRELSYIDVYFFKIISKLRKRIKSYVYGRSL